MDDNTNLATQENVDDGSQVDNAAGAGGANDGANDQPFLQVNERTIYKTPDEAKAGFVEAQKTITSLSGMKTLVESYVGKGNASPEVIKSLFEELVAARAEKAAAAAKTKNTSSGGDEDPRFEGKSAEEIKAIKAADKWYKEQAEKHGFVSKTELEKLQAEMAELKGAPEKQLESANNDAIRTGREWLDKQLSDAKLSLTDGELKRLTGRIQAYVDGDEETLGRWWNAVRSGNRAEQQSIIKEAAEFALPSVKPGASFKSANVTTVKTKAQLAARTARTLPAQGTGREQQSDKQPAKFSGLKDPKLTKAAMDRIDEIMAEQG